MTTLIVDAANVVGSRPDGWWRDRAGAASRLLDRLRHLHLGADEDVVVVLEGVARAADEQGSSAGVRVVHAPGSGDDTIVELTRALREAAPDRPVTVITADRGLRARLAALGAEARGPGWLWQRLDDARG